MDQTTHKVEPARGVEKRPVDNLQSEIERARSETARTINEIQRRLAPSHIREQVRRATAGKAETMASNTGNRIVGWGASLVESIRHNPIAAAVVGGGLAWMITSELRGDSRTYEEEEEEYYTGPLAEERLDLRYGYEEEFEEPAETGESRAGRAAGKIREKGSEWRSDLGDRASQVSAQLRERAGSMRQSGRQAAEGISAQVDENPLAIAGIAFAVGAVMGFTLPESRREREQFGPWRERVVERVRQAGRETLEKAERVAEHATEAAREEAERQNLISKESGEEAEAKAREAARKAEQKAEEKSPGANI